MPTLPVLLVLALVPPQGAPARPPLPSGAELAALPEDGGPRFNRLVFESSPYLRQHAANPVDWYPWGDAAFAKAEREEKPVLLSIGYSTCHWCHVMEHESFEDAAVAELLNAHFVSVKVDREERPDVDQLYMRVVQGMTGSGGWPMTVFLTPAREPFWAATYLPKEARGGRSGMLEVLPEIARAWRERRADVQATAGEALAYLVRTTAHVHAAGEAGHGLDAALLERAREELLAQEDREHGGFGGAPKFPLPHRLRWLLREARRSGDEAALAAVLHTLERMRAGGVYDQLGGGFHRYSTDARWLVPHFEKMLYDQALLAPAYVEAWQASGRPELARTAREVLDYLLRELATPAGALRSAEDADSGGGEGLFYTWTPAELEVALGADDARLAALHYGVDEPGNLPDEATREPTGRSVLHVARPAEELAHELGLPLDALAPRLADVRAQLLDARARRPRPFLDDKVLADWNGLAIAALAGAARALDEPRYARAASAAADFALTHLRTEDGGLHKRWRAGAAGLPPVLDDYAFLVHGLLELYQTTFEPRHLASAVELAERMLADFQDTEHGGFFVSLAGRADLLVRARELGDGALPSGHGLATLDLIVLAHLTGDMRYEELATRALASAAGAIRAAPAAHAQHLIALDLLLAGPSEVVIAGERDAPDTQALLRTLARGFRPHVVLHLRPREAPPELLAVAAWLEPLVAREERATAYVCRDFACQAPSADPEELVRALDGTPPSPAQPGEPGPR